MIVAGCWRPDPAPAGDAPAVHTGDGGRTGAAKYAAGLEAAGALGDTTGIAAMGAEDGGGGEATKGKATLTTREE